MWSKFKDIVFGKKERSPQELIALAINEMNKALYRHEKACKQASEREAELAKKLQAAQQEIDQWKQQITQAVQQENDAEAKRLLAKETLLKQRLEQFQAIHQQALKNAQALEKQQTQLVLKLEEAKSKKVMLTTTLDTTQNQQELQQFMEGLDSGGAWSGIDISLDEFSGDDLDIWDAEIDAALGDSMEEQKLQEIQKEIEEKTAAKHREAAAKKLKHASGFFSNQPSTPPQEPASDKKKRQQQIQQFLDSSKEVVNNEDKEAMLDAFMKATASVENNIEKEEPSLTETQQALFERFLEERPEKDEDIDWAAKALDQMDKEQQKNTGIDPNAQKSIDDFFKDDK